LCLVHRLLALCSDHALHFSVDSAWSNSNACDVGLFNGEMAGDGVVSSLG
jgi:hypothetical protein